MASPAVNGVSTPPAATNQPTPPTSSTADRQATSDKPTATTTTTSAQPLPAEPATSLQDDGHSRRPRDIRNIHMLLTNNGVHSYQERVPLMLLDYAYRYTSGILSDAQAITAETGNSDLVRGPGSKASKNDEGGVSLLALRQAIAARNHFHIQPQLSKEDLLELSSEVNRVALPRPEREYGLRLPHEKYCLTGVGFGIKEEWSEDEEILDDEEDEELGDDPVDAAAADGDAADETMKDRDAEGTEGKGVEDEEIDQDEFEDVMMGGE